MCWTKMLKSSLSELLASSSPLWPNLNTAVPVISVQFHLVDFGSDSNSQWVSYVVQPVEFSDLVNMTLSVLSMAKKMLNTNPVYPPFLGSILLLWAGTCLSSFVFQSVIYPHFSLSHKTSYYIGGGVVYILVGHWIRSMITRVGQVLGGVKGRLSHSCSW